MNIDLVVWTSQWLKVAFHDNKRYWQRSKYNWKRWKRVEPAGREKERLTAVYEVVEEEEGKIKEWNKEDKIDQMENALGEL